MWHVRMKESPAIAETFGSRFADPRGRLLTAMAWISTHAVRPNVTICSAPYAGKCMAPCPQVVG